MHENGFKQKSRIWFCQNKLHNQVKTTCGPGTQFLYEMKNDPICAYDKTPGQEFLVLIEGLLQNRDKLITEA